MYVHMHLVLVDRVACEWVHTHRRHAVLAPGPAVDLSELILQLLTATGAYEAFRVVILQWEKKDQHYSDSHLE